MKRITSRDNPTVKQLHALATSARERRACGETLLDGAHLLGVALERGWQPRLVVASESGRAQPEIAALLARCNAARGNLVAGRHLGARAHSQLGNVLAQGQGGLGHQHVVVGVQVQQRAIGS